MAQGFPAPPHHPSRPLEDGILFLRRGTALCLIVSALAAGSGCRSDRPAAAAASASITVTDNTGHVVALMEPARRVISLVPARTDLILALGAADRLVARTAFDDDGRLAGLPSVGDALSPSVEWLAERRPDLVIAWPDAGSRSVVAHLDNLAIPVYTSRVETLAELRRTIDDLGRLLGLESAADSVRQHIDTALARVRMAVRGKPRPRVLYLIGLDPPVAAGPGTFVQELIEAAGGENAMADAPMRWPQVSLEHLLADGADVLIVTSERPPSELLTDLRGRAGWRELKPVRRGRVHIVDADLFNRPGPSLVEAILALAGILHPDALDAGQSAGTSSPAAYSGLTPVAR